MQLRTEHRLVDQWLVDEVLCMGVDLIEISGGGEEAAALERETLRQGAGAEGRLLHRDRIVGGHGRREVAVEAAGSTLMGQREFRLAQAEVARPRSDLAAVRHEAGDRVAGRVLRQGIGTAQDDGDGGD
ncbi:MAG: hypothetical protein U1F06_08685 [Steroidobacteraceae bacterium]